MPLDKTKPFGKVCPPENGVAYIQGSKFFDAQFCEVTENGKPIEKVAPSPAPQDETKGEVPQTVEGLLKAKDTMPFFAFKAAAQTFLGPDIPSLKEDIVTALKARLAKQKAPPPPSVEPSGETPLPEQDDTVKALYAWGTGAEKRLFGDLQKMARQKFHKQIANERDMINFLIDEGIVPPEIAINV